jgi:predicted AAA+ superfamily ATPase
VTTELVRLIPHTETVPAIRHWRSHHGDQVDVVLEDRRGRLIAIEIKPGASVGRTDLHGIRRFREPAGTRFVVGMVPCTGRQTLPARGRTWVLPTQVLWI